MFIFLLAYRSQSGFLLYVLYLLLRLFLQLQLLRPSLFLLRLHLPISQHQSHSVLSPFPQITTVNWFACQLPFIFGNSPNSVKAPRAYVIKKGKGSLPKTVTRQRRDHDLNPGSSAPESQLHTNHSATEPRLCD